MEQSQNAVQGMPSDDLALKEALNRVLTIGQLLLSVLTEEEMEELHELLSEDPKIGNTSVT